MSRIKGAVGTCRGMSNKQVRVTVDRQYTDFCRYRWELALRMPDRRIGLFDARVFTEGHFEVGE